VGRRAFERDRQQEFDERRAIPKDELLRKLRRVIDEADEVLDSLDDEALMTRRTIQNYDVTVLEAVYHVVEHFSMHTGQIILLSKMLTQGDMRFYDFSGNAPKENWDKKSGVRLIFDFGF